MHCFLCLLEKFVSNKATKNFGDFYLGISRLLQHWWSGSKVVRFYLLAELCFKIASLTIAMSNES